MQIKFRRHEMRVIVIHNFSDLIGPLPEKPKGTLGLHSVRLSVRQSVLPSVSQQYQFSLLFSKRLQILSRILTCKSITSLLKSNAHKDRYISCIIKDVQIPSFTSKRTLYFKEYIQGTCYCHAILSECLLTLYLTLVRIFQPMANK